jgi:hypothetical protein
MAQTLLMQECAPQQAKARLAAGGGAGSFLPPGGPPYGQPYQQPYAPQPYAYAPSHQQGGGMGGFLAGAGKVALGVGGGILVADAVMGPGHDLFGGRGYQQQRFDYDQSQDRDDGGFGQDPDDGGFGQQDDSSNDWAGGSDDGGGSCDR